MNGSPEELVEVTIERAATGGGVGRMADGRVVFVRHSLPGERVRIRVTDSLRSFARGDAIEIEEASSQRVVAPCSYSGPGRCGGCDLQHATQLAQLTWKANLVAEQLRRVAKVDRGIRVRSAPTGLQGWRTRLRCAVDGGGHLALYRQRSRELVPIDTCYVADPRFSSALTSNWSGAVEVELRAIGEGDPYAVVSLGDGQIVTADLDGLIDESPRRSAVVVAGKRFRVSARSFWQAHCDGPNVLTREVLELANLKRGDRVVDLFAGVGLFAVALAGAVGPQGKVLAIEVHPSAVSDARHNVADLDHVKVVAGKVTPKLIAEHIGSREVVVLDPPRAGAGVDVMQALVAAGPRRIVYVSCDAATFARDLRVALDGGYGLGTMRAWDLFPMTEHTETVAVLDAAT